MGRPIYTDEGTIYPELMQPEGTYVCWAEDEFDGQEVTWPEVHARAWELQRQEDHSDDD